MPRPPKSEDHADAWTHPPSKAADVSPEVADVMPEARERACCCATASLSAPPLCGYSALMPDCAAIDAELHAHIESLGFVTLMHLASLAHERELCAARSVLGESAPLRQELLNGDAVGHSDMANKPSVVHSPQHNALPEVWQATVPPTTESEEPVKNRKSTVSIEDRTGRAMQEVESDDENHCCKLLFEKTSDEIFEALSRDGPQPTVMERSFDAMMNALVVVSAAMLFFELEVKGNAIGRALASSVPVEKADTSAFFIAEHIINAVFLAELFFRIGRSRKEFFWSSKEHKLHAFNCLDCLIVFTCSLDLYVIPQLTVNKGSGSLSTLRMLRLLRLTRALRVLRVMTAFSKLRILLNTTASSFMSLFWAMILMFLYVYGSALILCQMLQSTVEDPEVPVDLRLWIYRYYGSGSKSIWTLFEITFSGGWPNYARRLIEEVHWSYQLFFATYVWVVVFAVTRIITALFLKDTLQAANEDADMVIREQKAIRDRYIKKIRELFRLVDDSGDGVISLSEFQHVAVQPKVRGYFSALDLQLPEICELFALLDNGDGLVSYTEFCQGVMRLKGQARAMDVISTMRDTRTILQKCQVLEEKLEDLRPGRMA